MPSAACTSARLRWAPRAALRAAVVASMALGPLAACSSAGDAADATTFCRRLEQLVENDPFLAFGETATAGEMRAAFTALRQRSEELAEVAPAEAKVAARDYRDAVRGLDHVLADADYGTDVDVRAYRDHQVAYVEASQRLDRYLAAECGAGNRSTTSTTR